MKKSSQDKCKMIKQLDLFEQDFLSKWEKVTPGSKTLAAFCREIGFDYKTAWFLTHSK
jgi:hypothetical protein